MRTTALLGLAVLMLVFALPAGANIDRQQRSLSALTSPQLHGRRVAVAHTVAFYRSHRWMLAARHATCWARVPWSRTCNRARLEFRARRAELSAIDHRLAALEQRRLLATTSTYLGAVSYVEKYFGPQPFLRECPKSEGGLGAWVYIGHADHAVYGPSTTPGGWLQFMGGTFYGIIDRAIAEARARGMVVPATARSWFSPLGQALAGRTMIERGRRGEWTGGTC